MSEKGLQWTKEEPNKDNKGTCRKIRYIAVFSCFMGEFFLFFHRITMSVSIVAMVSKPDLLKENDTAKSCIDLIEKEYTEGANASMRGEFQWSPEMQGYILGSSVICYIISIPILSSLAEQYGAKKILLSCIFFPSLFTFLSPFAARWNAYALIVVQSLRGLFQGGILSTESILIANWCPKKERGSLYTISVCGSSIGAVVGSYLTGVLCESSFLGGWPSAFFVNGSIGFFISIIIYFILYDNPSAHPRISTEERDYILRNQENIMTEKRPKIPWKKLFTSVPVYAFAYAIFGQLWAIGYFVTINPIFLKTILHFSVEQDGLFNALPFILAVCMSQIANILSTVIIKKNLISVNRIRKFWTLFSCFGYSACILGIYFAGCNRTRTIILSIAALSFIGFCFAGCWIVATDMSPTFAGSVNSIACTFGSLSDFFMPVIVGYLTNISQTIEQWQVMFVICIAVILSSGILFAIFGSAEIQPWNDVPQKNSHEMKKEAETKY